MSGSTVSGEGAPATLRIIEVIGTLNYGGGETQLVRLAHELQQRGHTVRVLAIGKLGPLAPQLDEYGVEYVCMHFRGYDVRHPITTLGAIVRTARSIRAFRPDVVHAHLVGSMLLTMPLSWLLRVPVRASGRLNLAERDSVRPRARWLYRVARRCANVFIANADAVAVDALAGEGMPAHKMRVIENGVEIPDEPADVSQEPPIGFVVANFRPQKNHANLMQALALMPNAPEIHLVGSGPEQERIEKLAADLGLQNVVFEGAVRNGGRRYLAGQFAVLPSDYEGLPNAVLEAMACGLPMVATAVAGIPELIDDDVDGLLVPARDPEALAAAIQRLLDDPALRARLGSAARERIAELSWDRCTQRHEDLYREVLTSGSPRHLGAARSD